MSTGFVLTGNTDLVDIWATKNDWEHRDRNNTAISSAGVLGLSLGAIFSKLITDWGRRRSILLANMVITMLTLPYFFTSNFWILLFTRLLIGFFSSLMINASSLYIAESVPTESQANIGIFINLGVVAGIFFNNLFGLLLPDSEDKVGMQDDQLWKISYSLQLFAILGNTILWSIWFQTEPVQFLVTKADKLGQGSDAFKEALKVIKRNYGLVSESEPLEVYGDISRTITESRGGQESPGYMAALTDPQYRIATYICVILSISNQFTGINAINIYSTHIYQ